MVTCAAIAPECGTCYGKIIDEECYVTSAQFDNFKKVYPSLQAE